MLKRKPLATQTAPQNNVVVNHKTALADFQEFTISPQSEVLKHWAEAFGCLTFPYTLTAWKLRKDITIHVVRFNGNQFDLFKQKILAQQGRKILVKDLNLVAVQLNVDSKELAGLPPKVLSLE